MLETWQLFCQVLYGIPVAVLYIIIVWLFLKKKNVFKSSFFKISIFIGFVDITLFVTTWWMLKFPACPLTYQMYPGTESLFLYPIGSFLSYYLTMVRFYLLITSSLNRLTAVSIPSKYDKFWLNYIKYIISICFAIPIPLTFHILFGKTNIYPSPPVVVIDVKAAWFPISRALLNAIQSTMTSFLTFLFNAITLYLLWSRKSQQKVNSMSKAEIGLIFICCYDFFINLIFAGHQTTMYLYPSRDATYTMLLQLIVWISDLNNLSRPIFFIFMCKPIRKAFSQLFTKKAKYNREIELTRSKGHITVIT